MKKKLGLLLLSCLCAFLLISCNEVLSVVTVDDDGQKIVNNYVSIHGNTVYDESISMKHWQNIELFSKEINDDFLLKVKNKPEELLFKIENKKEKVVVLGDGEGAIEIHFFEGGYKYTIFSSMDSLENSMNMFSNSLSDSFKF